MFDWLESMLEEAEQADQWENEGDGAVAFLPLTGVRVLSVNSASTGQPADAVLHADSGLTEGRTELRNQTRWETLTGNSGSVWAGTGEQGSTASAAYHLRRRGEEGSVLRTLYQDVARASYSVTSKAGVYRSMTEHEEAVLPRSLTVLELDRAVRRDSRRFDGGMSIY